MAQAIAALRSEEDLQRLLGGAGDQPVLIFKHSTTCPVSARAHAAFLAASAGPDLDGVRLGLVRVIEERPLSQSIAMRFGVTHQSPQALVVRGGRAVWNASHAALTRQAIRDAVRLPTPAQ